MDGPRARLGRLATERRLVSAEDRCSYQQEAERDGPGGDSVRSRTYSLGCGQPRTLARCAHGRGRSRPLDEH